MQIEEGKVKREKGDFEKAKKPQLLRIATSLKLTVGSSPKPNYRAYFAVR